jgi:hypothetical protein
MPYAVGKSVVVAGEIPSLHVLKKESTLWLFNKAMENRHF